MQQQEQYDGMVYHTHGQLQMETGNGYDRAVGNSEVDRLNSMLRLTLNEFSYENVDTLINNSQDHLDQLIEDFIHGQIPAVG